jgi:hypothetical protein
MATPQDQQQTSQGTGGSGAYSIFDGIPEPVIRFLLWFAYAIARFEGYYVPQSRAQRNRNPGNLRAVAGQASDADGFRTFGTHVEGWLALIRQIERNILRGLTLNEFFGGKPGVYPGYAPASDGNDPVAYARFVGSVVRMDPSEVIFQHITRLV